MKWKHPKRNDTRVVTRFLFKPKSLEETTMWLCFAKIEQRRYAYYSWYGEGLVEYWEDMSFKP